MPTAIVLAAHGSRHPGAMAALAAFGARLSRELPDTRVEIARTVGRKHGGRHDFGGARRVPDILAALAADGVGRVAVQSLHVVPGEEYHDMLAGLGRFLEGNAAGLTVSVGAPLLASLADVDRVAEAVLASLPGKRSPAEAVVVMGHGAPPPGAGFYDVLAEKLGRLDALAHFGTMPREKGAPCPDIGRIRDTLVRHGVRAAWLLPFFTEAGAHACCDLAGDGPDSWRGILEAAGIRCAPLLCGLIEQPAMAALWREHLQTALSRLP
ncbi:sirohydrochlorin cobaltochelatase [Solidesulfovibrio sp.]|uniref:sirohydrochlorin cobaltochelatase n=1 Tax=Solidesulfovibrio sp. TaxID=2910990 RepID=UPI002B1FA699|nr:sirohydrochlorin cobaltochelatase [Solidesulfovibrio sp.]MEA4857406.1 sirohydrochlorin cobaltochelatase [Solidesulfovibrio sp.]